MVIDETKKPFVFMTEAESGLTGIVNLRYLTCALPVSAADRMKGAHDKARSVIIQAGGLNTQCREEMEHWEKVFIEKELLDPPAGTNPT